MVKYINLEFGKTVEVLKMNNWKMMLYRLMQGRHGNDELSQFLMIAGLVMLLVSNFLRLGIFHTLAWVMLVYAYFRVMSRNIPKRQQENRKFLEMKANFMRKKSAGTGGWQQKRAQKQQAKQAKQQAQQQDYSQYQQEADTENYNYYRCRNCGQIVRVPKGKGTVKITCPECKNTFTDRT